ncbi:MAG TPA: AMP-binding protein [Acidimicrobiales bacterium]|nr:AMP-binding protein [Acidimicrobiales bacterium]
MADQPDVRVASLAEPLRNRAATDPARLAVVDGSVELTYAELDERAQSLARAMCARGVERGDVVTMQLPNWWEAAVVYQATMLLGCVLNPIVPIYRAREVSFIERQCRPRVVVIPHVFRGFDHLAMHRELTVELEEPPLVVVVRPDGDVDDGAVAFDDLTGSSHSLPTGFAPDDICLLLYTSGTTADPKGVLHSHRTIAYEIDSIIELCRLGPDDHIFMASPVTHITGYLYGLVMPAVTGAAVILQDVWEPGRAAELIEERECRFSVGATPFLHGLVDEYARRGQSSTLRTFLCGGADVPPPLVRNASAQLDAHVTRVYGSSEFPTATCGRIDDGFDITAETDGVPIGPVDCRLDRTDAGGVGELLLRGPDLFLGYLDASLNLDAFTEDGFFRTGDLASIAASGAVTIRGRHKDIIVRGGENISAKEVEDVLFEHPAVSEVAVVAMPDPVMVERSCAFVVPREGATVTLATLAAFLDEHHLARQKYPERVEIVDELPKTASGKVQKFVLRAHIAEQLAAEQSGPRR